MELSALFIAVLFICIYLLANKIIPTAKIKRLRWLSFSGGLAVSYVFVYILPSMHREQQSLEQTENQLTMSSELYFIGLIGLLTFFGLQTKLSQLGKTEVKTKQPLLWTQTIFFAFYNLFIVYTVITSHVTGIQALFYAAAVGLHFIAVSHDLWRENQEIYLKYGRFIMVFSIIAGLFIGTFIPLGSLADSLIFAFVSGAMILNVLKNELPSNQEAHFPTFAFGVIAYTSFTITLKFFFEW
ncbi:hypothetical protein [Halalkalibacter akibai]|uniref:Uncharacterized protein n=1 Tax=Halalkalibacter akibai (strain ATCC 43226 / DSM 21942 / CIP 109018 / JCM 9157 / 1139) TaxID=1236973 RepID=W4QRF0_HALA3|nr:hypothetical protein [Halalkalibacter akibai]GAE34492.1 hypothetical protein JCM9157_1553 [Halalkalibacter akibai JCM 9157]